jgi:hypothetical protein
MAPNSLAVTAATSVEFIQVCVIRSQLFLSALRLNRHDGSATMLAGVDCLCSSVPGLDCDPLVHDLGIVAAMAGDRLGEAESANKKESPQPHGAKIQRWIRRIRSLRPLSCGYL